MCLQVNRSVQPQFKPYGELKPQRAHINLSLTHASHAHVQHIRAHYAAMANAHTAQVWNTYLYLCEQLASMLDHITAMTPQTCLSNGANFLPLICQVGINRYARTFGFVHHSLDFSSEYTIRILASFLLQKTFTPLCGQCDTVRRQAFSF